MPLVLPCTFDFSGESFNLASRVLSLCSVLNGKAQTILSLEMPCNIDPNSQIAYTGVALMTTRILVVDDEPWVVQSVRSYLEAAHFEVVAAYNGKEAIAQFDAHEPDLIILDWMLPEMDGLTVAHQLRQRSRVPIIMLTARVDEEDRIAGLETGADDYVIKPFSARELEARVRAVLRRSKGETSSVLEVGPIRLDHEQRQVRVEGEQIELTAMEFDLLAFLMAQPGRVFTRLELLEAVRGDAYGGFERSVDSHIKRLRQKIEPDPHEASLILTVFGVGYKLAKEGKS